MAKTLAEVYTAHATLAALRNRTAAAIAKAAWAILELSPADTEARLTWAKEAVPTAEAIATAWMWAVCGNVSVQDADFEPIDGDLEYVVGVLINNYAGPAA